MISRHDFLIVGAGIFGLTAALELRSRGYGVTLLNPVPIPDPRASSTDISKAIRMEYGHDIDYMRMVDQAIDGWHEWNEAYGVTLYYQVGMTFLCPRPMEEGHNAFAWASYQALLSQGHKPERLDPIEIAKRFPAWNTSCYVDGFFHARAGFADSGKVVKALAKEAGKQGVQMEVGHTVKQLLIKSGRVTGVQSGSGRRFQAEHVIVCAGAHTPLLVPELSAAMRITGHPVFHVRPSQPALFTPPRFTVFAADISNTGWYGFPLHPEGHVVKIANHGPGVRLHPARDPRLVTAEDEQRLRRMLRQTLPALADDPIAATRLCLYCDTRDEHFWIDRHPTLKGLTVAAGGSGHGFKMAPLLGRWIAAAALGNEETWLDKFRWRAFSADVAGQEEARFHG